MGSSSTRIFLLVTVISGAWGLCYPTCTLTNGSSVEEGTRVPNPSTCNEFFVCSDPDLDGNMDLSDDALACADGMYFDQNSATCQQIPDDGSYFCSPCNPCEVECNEPGAVAPDPYSCNDYFVCLQDGDYIEAQCGDGEGFDFQSSVCVDEGEARCFEACNKCEIYCVEEGKIPDPFDCHAYLYCEPGVGTAQFTCPDGTYYDNDSQECIEDTSNTCTNLCASATTVSSGAPSVPSDTITDPTVSFSTTTSTTTGGLNYDMEDF